MRTTPASSLGGPIKRDRLWFFGSYRKLTTAQGVEGIFGNAYAFDATHWDYLKDTSLSVRDVQGRNMYQGRVTAQVTPKNRVTFSQENQYRCQGSTLTIERRRLPHARRRLDRAWDRPRCHRRRATGYFDFPYYLTQATWTATATNRLLLEAGFSRLAYATADRDRIAGRHLRPDPGRRAGGHRRSPRQLRVPRHQHRRRQLPEHQELARLGVVRDRRAQREGRLPGGYQGANSGSITNDPRLDLSLQQPRAEPVHVPASGFPDGQSDDDAAAVRRRTPGRTDG